MYYDVSTKMTKTARQIRPMHVSVSKVGKPGTCLQFWRYSPFCPHTNATVAIRFGQAAHNIADNVSSRQD